MVTSGVRATTLSGLRPGVTLVRTCSLTPDQDSSRGRPQEANLQVEVP